MNNFNKIISFSIAFYVLFSCSDVNDSLKKDYTKYVDPFIGTSYNGHTFPGATTPFGMIQTSPVTGSIGWKYCAEYIYSDSLIYGFTQTHLNGTGCTDLGDIRLMPISGNYIRMPEHYVSAVDKSLETASPGYYSVKLIDEDINVELTASTHSALHHYTFNKPDSAALLIDLQHGPSWNIQQYKSQVLSCSTKWEDNQTLTGHVRNRVWVTQDYFFVIKFSKPVVDTLLLNADETEIGKRYVAIFDMKSANNLFVKVGLSTISVDGAKKNLESEIPDWNFNRVRQDAVNKWNDYLSRIEVEGSEDELKSFYTSFYHALIQPNQISDIDGYYRNAKDSIVKAGTGKFYSTFSLWDTYRAAHPFYTLIVPDKVDDFVNSLVEQGEVQGFLPIWGLWGRETYCMIGNHGVSVIAEAYRKGFRGFDAERAYDIVKKTQTISHREKSDWETYMKYGYLPTDLVKSESVSVTLESTYDDYAAADMARRLNKAEDAEYFAKRADFYKNLFDKQTMFMRPKNSDGSWKTPFNPSDVAHAESTGGDYTEGNAWQYTWHVQHDIPGLIELFGGPDKFLNKLDSLFTVELVTAQADVTGLIGQYAHGNEPSHHVAYLYTIAGRPERTQELVREIFDNMYNPTPDGLSGNDDCGQMSAWYMLSAMGFYPVNPISGDYIFGAPQLPRIVLNLNNGKKFEIIAEGLSKENKYVESITLNGKPYSKNFISHEDIVNGGTLVYKMTDKF